MLASPAIAAPKVIINRSSQLYTVIDNGVMIKTGRVSTGRKTHPTPVGIFTIHAKYKSVMSEKYRVPMVNAMFFKGTKYAIHQGQLPGYPASHGCVRLSKADAKQLYSLLPIGTTVTIQ